MKTVGASAPEPKTGRRVVQALLRFWEMPGAAWGILVFACLGSRLATTITYVEDPDSLRFALSVADEYNVAALQPHFPGYPVFWFVTELFAVPTGRFSVSFSIVGGLATLGLIWALLRLFHIPLRSPRGLALSNVVLFNPLLWLMGNRYMPDLLGVAWAFAALAFLIPALYADRPSRRADDAVVGLVLVGLLAGLRLSYLPLVLIPTLLVLWYSERWGRLLVAAGAGVAVWLVPMLLDTGLWTLLDVAQTQTTGHFSEFGGTVHTESDLGRRLVGLVQGLWAGGLAGWWPGRHPLTALTGLGMLGVGLVGARRLWRNGVLRDRRTWLLAACMLVYAAWIFFFQNVVHKSRHVLPLVPFLVTIPAIGAVALWKRQTKWTWGPLVGAGSTYVAVTLVLVTQHLDPSAIAQAKNFVQRQAESHPNVRVASVPLVNNYLRAQRVEVPYLSVEDTADVRRLRETNTSRTLVVGTYASLLDREPSTVQRFYHNPYVNRMWPEVTVYVYEP